MINERPYEGEPLEPPEPFVASEYYALQNVLYQPCQSLASVPQYSMAQSIQATQDTISSLKAQLAMANINMVQQQQMQNINSMLQSYAALWLE